MGSSVLISVGEYLSTTYRPDCDFLDGEVKERNMGEQPHAHVQNIIGSIFRNHRTQWGVRALAEQRVQITSSRYRIPDLCILRNTDSKSPVIDFAPLLCIEILSSDDRKAEIQERVLDYVSVGTPLTWVIDPWKRLSYHATKAGWELVADAILRVPNTIIEVHMKDIFLEIDEG